ncbi:MAG: molecular chaperone DnaK [Candidatus Aminicenantes bacterium]|nr:molecular chaperone DnaK [Candidatus Aminicenantes bacterium]
MAINLGIDLGTTNSCISYLEGSETAIIPNPEGSRVIPSMVALTREGKRIFGIVAKRQFVTNSQNTIWGVKRLMGRKFSSKEIQTMQKMVGFEIEEAENGDVKIKVGNKIVSPEEISGMLLGYLRQISEEYLGEKIGDVVITVPAFFNDAQRQATKNAGEIAGMNVIRIINEPTAAMIAYGSKVNKDGLYAVYDLGGGTFDISIMEVQGDVYKVLSTLGDTFLGGSDFDTRIIDWIISKLDPEISTDIAHDRNTLQRILQISEKAKIELSFNQETLVAIPYLYHLPDGSNYHFQKKLTRTQFEHETTGFVDRTISLIKKSMDEINVKPNQIERLILVGGQSRMPLVQKKLIEFFGKEPYVDLNPEEVVAQGAALQSEIIKGKVKDMLLLDTTSLSLGVETKGNQMTRLIDKNSTIPIKRSKIFTTINDNQRTVKIHVLQGEREIASENKSLGYFNLVGIPLAPRGIPQINVTFEINSNGIVRVSAKDKQTGLSQSLKIQPASGLSPEDIQRIISESEEYDERDRKQIRLNELKDKLTEEYEAVKYFFSRHKEKIKQEEKNEIKRILAKTEKAFEEDDPLILESLLKKIQNQRIRINEILIADFEN